MFNLTRQERMVLFSLALVFLFGISFNIVFKKNPGLGQIIAVLDNDTLYRRMDVNTASYAEIVNCPNIGPAIAGRIIAYRRDKGPFRDLEELKTIAGIGENHFQNIAKFLIIHGK